MTRLHVEDREGNTTSLDWTAGNSLMEALRSAGHDVAGTCGGACSCGTCHVYVADADLPALPAAGEDERDMLDALSDVVAVRPGSRLACQLRAAGVADLHVTIAPQP